MLTTMEMLKQKLSMQQKHQSPSLAKKQQQSSFKDNHPVASSMNLQ